MYIQLVVRFWFLFPPHTTMVCSVYFFFFTSTTFLCGQLCVIVQFIYITVGGGMEVGYYLRVFLSVFRPNYVNALLIRHIC
jgi:hypothetical protein